MLKLPRYYQQPPEMRALTITDLIGQTVVKINNEAQYNDQLEFVLENGQVFVWYHEQDCCESVEIGDIVGDLNDLIGSPILRAEERSEQGPEEKYSSSTWTFYEFATIKGSVTIRWIGESNGYYSESVDLMVLSKAQVDAL